MIKINHVLHGPIDSIDFPEVDLPDNDSQVELTDENFDQTDIDGAEGWWNAWCEVRDIVDEAFEGDIEGGQSATLSQTFPYGEMRARNDNIHLKINLYNGERLWFIAEYHLEGADKWVMLYEEDAPWEKFERTLMRNVIQTELAIIANTTQSAAEAIDYWMTEHDDYMSWSQSQWAEVRGVGRQTVNDRVRSAVDKIDS
jgi:hypothetical protein